MVRSFFIVLIYCSSLFAQTENSAVYEIPFASTDNSIELEIVNTGLSNEENITIKAVSMPEWMQIQTNQHKLNKISGKEKAVTFMFDVDISAPVLCEIVSTKERIVENKGVTSIIFAIWVMRSYF